MGVIVAPGPMALTRMLRPAYSKVDGDIGAFLGKAHGNSLPNARCAARYQDVFAAQSIYVLLPFCDFCRCYDNP
jgi:hypothetical protein